MHSEKNFKILSLYALLLIIILSISVFTLFSIRSLISTSEWVSHTYHVIGNASNLGKCILNIRDSSQDFFISGHERYLKKYEQYKVEIGKSIIDTKQLVNDNPAQVALLGEISKKLEQLYANLASNINDKKEGTFNPTNAANNDKLIRQIMKKLDDFTKVEKDLLTVRDQQQDFSAWLSQGIFIFGNIAIILLGIVAVKSFNQQVSTKGRQQDWLKSGQAELNSLMSGDQNISILVKNVISFLTTYLEAKVGLFYLLQEPNSSKEPAFLQMMATYAYTPPVNFIGRVAMGEGLVGEVALKRQAIARNHTSEECTYIECSALSYTIPRHVLIVPILHETTLKGVIEFGAIKPLTNLQQEFLTQALENIGIAVNTAEARTQMQALLEKSQYQSQELKRVNEELQAQTEELRVQQEELSQNNEELKLRSHNLEQQKDEIRKKNSLLEQTQEEIKIKAKEVEAASKYKSEFLANMSHELRTPLNSILVLSQTLTKNSEGNLTEKQVEQSQVIHQSGTDLLMLINDVLDLSKIEAGKMNIHLEKLAVADLAENIHRKFIHIAEEKSLHFETIIADNLPEIIHSDAQRLNQIITNLLSNAFKFTHEGKIQLAIEHPLEKEEITEGQHPNEMIAIRVIDSGIGIPKHKQQLIFEAFQQADGTTSRNYGGTGLGLSISREFSKLLGGKLSLISEEGKGSIFTLYLPASSPQLPVKPHQNHENNEQPQIDLPENEQNYDITLESDNILAGKKALIVDDDQRNSFALSLILDEIGMITLSCNTGPDALSLLEREPDSETDTDILLMDIMMPEMDGYETMRRIRMNPRFHKLPIIALTAKAMKDDKDKCIEAGANDYLTKPVDTNKLLSLIELYPVKNQSIS